MAELLLDSKIRVWVFLPLMAITFLVGIIKHYLFIFMSNDKTVDKQQIIDGQVMLRSRILRENGRFIPKEVNAHNFQTYDLKKRCKIYKTNDSFFTLVVSHAQALLCKRGYWIFRQAKASSKRQNAHEW